MESGWRSKMHFRSIYLVPVLAFLSLAAWALASPVGAAPDDDFHMVSIWCANGNPEYCLPSDADDTRIVPSGLLRSPCYAFDDEMSAGCQAAFLNQPAKADSLSKRGNFTNEYPALFYKAMGTFAGPEIERSVLVMRLVNAAVFVGLLSLLFALLPVNRRPNLVWAWLITTLPLGAFLIASTNPSSWAMIGVGMAWIALLGYFETEGKRRIALGALFLVSVIMAAGSRGDAAVYVIVAIGAVLVLTFKREKAYLLSALLPVSATVIALALFRTSHQIGSGVHGFGDSGPSVLDEHPDLSTFGLIAYNLLNIPFLWAGAFGGWGLGWLDTGLPDIVLWAGSSAFIGAGFVGLSRVSRRKLIVVAGVTLLLIFIPVYVLSAGGDAIGVNVQPRYVLPLIVLLGGLLLFDPPGRPISFSRGQVALIVFALAVSFSVSLQTNIRRYVTGTDEAGLNLDSGREWWWDTSITPNAVWLLGSVFFTAMLILLVREIAWKPHATVDEAAISSPAKKPSRSLRNPSEGRSLKP
jgi:hypothetical protein